MNSMMVYSSLPRNAILRSSRRHGAAAAAAAASTHLSTRVVVVSRRLSRSAVVRQTTSRLSSTSNTATAGSTTGGGGASVAAVKKKLQQPLHSSAKTEHSTPTLSMEQQGASASSSTTTSATAATTTTGGAMKQHAEGTSIPKPTMAQLKILFTASAVPMIGFGFMDNLVMIQAGSFIDNTIGVTMGLATMTAAAAGQVVSDVSGVIFGGSLERFLHKYHLIKASTLTPAQRALPLCRNVALFGAVCGVALGCGLGASCLLLMDLESRERAERAIQLQAVLNDMMAEAEEGGNSDGGGSVLHCESCTIHLAHLPAAERFASTHKKLDTNGKTKIDFLPSTASTTMTTDNNDKNDNKNSHKVSLAVRAAREGQSLMEENGSVLCTPILSKEHDGEVVAVLEFHTKKDSDDRFTPEDEKTAKVMARHIAIFMHRLID